MMAEEVANLFSAMDDPQRFLVHDIEFHRTVAAGFGQSDYRDAGRNGLGALL